MSEPVGNGPRSPQSSVAPVVGNAHKTREAEPEAREKVEKVIEGKVTTRKPAWWKRLGRGIIADDAKSIGDFVLEDVIQPALRNLIYDIINGGASRALYGTSKVGRKGPVSTVLGGSLRTQYNNVTAEPIRRIGATARARHDFNEIVLDSRVEAVEVVESLIALVIRYGSASVADLYDLVGATGSFADRGWGWTDLSTADVRQVRGGFLIDLPQPEPLR